MICLSVRNPRFSLNHPLSGIKASGSSMFANGKDLTVDNNTIPHSFPKKDKQLTTHIQSNYEQPCDKVSHKR